MNGSVIFLLTRPMRGATAQDQVKSNMFCISTHTPHAGRDAHGMRNALAVVRFLLTRPMRGATLPSLNEYTRACHFYSHASYEARPGRYAVSPDALDFYSHASYEARPDGEDEAAIVDDFYSHASYEARLLLYSCFPSSLKFLLTRLLRGATEPTKTKPFFQMISTHTPLTRRDLVHVPPPKNKFISTHTPLTRRDAASRFPDTLKIDFYSHASYEARPAAGPTISAAGNFYSHASYEARRHGANGSRRTGRFLLTRLLRGATYEQFRNPQNMLISTHTPLTRRDAELPADQISDRNFYSHASYEARHAFAFIGKSTFSFLLTRLLRGATFATIVQIQSGVISTHTPLTRRDVVM